MWVGWPAGVGYGGLVDSAPAGLVLWLDVERGVDVVTYRCGHRVGKRNCGGELGYASGGIFMACDGVRHEPGGVGVVSCRDCGVVHRVEWVESEGRWKVGGLGGGQSC